MATYTKVTIRCYAGSTNVATFENVALDKYDINSERHYVIIKDEDDKTKFRWFGNFSLEYKA